MKVLSLGWAAILWAAQCGAGPVDINSATASELSRNLLGVGPAIAQRIVEFREQQGFFPTPDSIQLVPGVGEKTYLKNIDFIQVVIPLDTKVTD